MASAMNIANISAASLAPSLSIVVPLTYGEIRWRGLFADLAKLPVTTEIIVVGPTCPEHAHQWLADEARRGRPTTYLKSPKGRGKQMNAAVHVSSRPFLWFLHADSRLPAAPLDILADAVARHSHAIWYFGLDFLSDGPTLTKINALAANLRADICKIPFGDQGFFMPRRIFDQLGGFAERERYGEDHLLIWHAHQQKIPVLNTGAKIRTSAAKYAQDGWLKTTLTHQYLTWKQALPQAVNLWRNR